MRTVILAGASLPDRVVACVGAAVGIALTGLLAALVAGAAWPLLVAPIGASAVLVFAVPASPMAQPWPVIGGNAISAFTGIAVAHAIPLPVVAAPVAVACAIAAMSLTRSLHPPGGAAALLATLGGPVAAAATCRFALVPVALDAALLVAAGFLFHRVSGHAYPHRAPPVVPRHPEDVDRALDDLGETFDIARADIDALLDRVEHHAAIRRGASGRASASRRAARPTA